MTEDAHAQANAEQVQVLREALVGTGPVEGEAQAAPEADGDPSPSPDPSPQTPS